ncbi:protein of unknown function [Sterolibacterium denitrificans]|uniref:Cadherin domain-containing protein n=1 Tax=Sterolibacterium denitrificans TaxID=157592 RepID=A0A7Z7HS71_9PROT|nr:hypothetical protein [Sterolibacterium denitrificans]SMB27240.1 protein of unknown function [Sterolibacterium denitrificans]
MATLTTVTPLSGAEENVHFGVSYAILKVQADESADVDCFKISAGTTGKLFYNTGTAASPVWVELTTNDFNTGRGVELRIDGLYINNVKKTASDAKLYWKGMDGSDAFKVQGVDNVDSVYDANDVISAGSASVSINVTPGEGGGGNDPENAPPVNTLGATSVETAGAKNAVTFSGSSLISVADADDEFLTTVVTVGSGKLTVAANSGAIVTGNNSASVKIQGTIEAINKALDGLKFEGGAGFTGTTLTVTTNDITQNKDIDSITIAAGTSGGDPTNAPPVNTLGATSVETAGAKNAVTFSGSSLISVADADDEFLTTVVTVGSGKLTVAANSGALVTGNNSASVKIQGTVEAINKALDGLKFEGGAGFTGTTLTVTTNDITQNKDIDSITIAAGTSGGDPTNAPPVNTLGATSVETTGAKNAVTFSGSSLISVADADDEFLTTVVTVGSGKLTVAANSGALVTGNNSASVKIQGTVEAINKALDGLKFEGGAGFTGTTLTVTTNDITQNKDIDSITIAAGTSGGDPTNAPPVNTLGATSVETTGAKNAVTFSGSSLISVADADDEFLTTVVTVGSGKLTVAANSGALVTGNNSASVKIQGTVEAINKALDGLKFEGGAGFTGTTLTVTTNDITQNKDIDSITIAAGTSGGDPTNAPPVNTLGATSVETTGAKNAVTFSGSSLISVADADDEFLTTVVTVGSGKLTVAANSGALVTGNNSASVKIQGTVEAINKALDGLKFEGGAGFTGTTLTVTTNDITQNKDIDSITIAAGTSGGDPTNAPPVNTLGATSVETTGAKNAVTFSGSSLISVADADDEFLTTVVTVGSGKLTVAANSGALVTGNNSASVKIQGTVEAINKALDGLKFEGGAGFTGTTLTVTTNDITQNKDIDSITIAAGTSGGDPTNAPPVNTLGATSVETTGAKNAVTFSGSSLISVADADDEFLTTVVTVGSGKLTVAANSGALVTGNNSASVKIQGTVEAINKALDGLKFEGGAGFTGTTLTITTNDITQNKDIDSITIAAGTSGGDPTNAPPVNTAPETVVISDTAQKTVTFSDDNLISVDDPDSPNLTTLLEVTNGTLKVAANSGAIVTGNNSASVKIQGTIEAINKALDGLVYTGGAGFTSTDTLTITTNDWLQAKDITVVTISATPTDGSAVAPAHSLKVAQATTTEDTALVFDTNKAIVVVDPDSDSLATVISVEHGVLTVSSGSGASITDDGSKSVTIVGNASQINAALNGLTYTPDSDYHGSDTLTIVTTDDTTPDPLTTSNAITLNVFAVNDAPVNIVPDYELGVSGANNTVTFNGNLAVNDVDGDLLTTVVEVTEGTLKVAPNSGAWVTGNNSASVKIQGTIEVINKALDGLVYTGGAGFSGEATLTITTNDILQTKDIDTVIITSDPDLAVPNALLTTDSGSSNTDNITNDGAITAPTNNNTDADVQYRVQKDGGAWSTWSETYTPPVTNGTADGAYVVQVRYDNGEKQSAAQSISFTLDTTAPTTTISGIDISADTGESASDFITRTEAQAITATLSTGLAVGEELYGSVDGGETWTNITNKIQILNPTAINWTGATLEEGSSSIQLQVRDKAGNAGPTASQAYTLDHTAPATTISGIDISADTGASDSDFITKTAAQTITATLSAGLIAGEELYGSVNNGTTWVNITGKVSGTSVTWDGATLAGSSSIKFEVRDAAGNAGTAASQSYILDTTAPTTNFSILPSASYDRASNTLTLNGSNMNSLLTTPGQTASTDIKAQLDWSKLIWDVDGANGANVTFTVADIASVYVDNGTTLRIVLTEDKASAIEGLANFGTNGTKLADKIDIAAGFAVDAAGNAATTDAKADMNLTGAFNQPKVYSYDLSSGATTGVIDTNMGIDTEADAVVFEPAKGDSLLIQGVSASQVTVSGGAIAGGTGNVTVSFGDRSVELTDYQGKLIGSVLNGAVNINFADGSVLTTNNGAQTVLTGGTGDDLLIAGNNGDTLVGLGGNNKLVGGDGNDFITGGDGNDLIIGGKGIDILTGGAGRDTFQYTNAADGEGADVITDFTAGNGGDVIKVIGTSIDAAWITSHAAQVNDDTMIMLDSLETILLTGVKVEDLTTDNFLGIPA